MHDSHRSQDENQVLRDVMTDLRQDTPPMPADLHDAWMQQVREDHTMQQNSKIQTRRSRTRMLSVAAAMIFVVGGTLLTSDSLERRSLTAPQDAGYVSYASYEDSTDTAGAPMMLTSRSASKSNGLAMTSYTSSATAESAAEASESKIIRTASVTLVTRSFDDGLAALKQQTSDMSGWIESLNQSSNNSGLRTAYLTLRIPQDQLDACLGSVSDLGRVTSRSENTQDVTASYQDTQARLNTQLALMARLQALITESADLDDLLALESQIAQTQYNIDTLQASLNHTDHQVNYSTVSITLKEEREPAITDVTVPFADRLLSAVTTGWQALTGFLGDMVVFLTASLPFLGVVAVAAIIVRLFRRKRRS